MATTITFDGLASPGTSVSLPDVPNTYAGFSWFDMGAHYVAAGDQNPDTGNGYGAALTSGDSVAFTRNSANVWGFIRPPANGTFSLVSMHMAAAWDKHLKVIFTPFDSDSHAGTPFKVTLNQHAQVIHFPDRFDHIQVISIKTKGGVDANADDNGAGVNLALDNVVVKFDPAPHGVHDAWAAPESLSAHWQPEHQAHDPHSLMHWALA